MDLDIHRPFPGDENYHRFLYEGPDDLDRQSAERRILAYWARKLAGPPKIRPLPKAPERIKPGTRMIRPVPPERRRRKPFSRD